jgi:hypothetical protein
MDSTDAFLVLPPSNRAFLSKTSVFKSFGKKNLSVVTGVKLNTGSQRTTALKSIGNILYGVAGVPPAKLIDSKTKDKLVAGTFLENRKLVCAYKASRDGWSAIDFHKKVDDRGSGLVVALSRSGTTFGGFNPIGWRSTDDYLSSNSAFLWFLEGGNLVKCPVLSGGNAAVFDYASGGPCFGAADLQIGSPLAAVMGGFAGPDMEDTRVNAGSLKQGRSSAGGAFDVSGWPVRGEFQLAEVECYCNAEIVPSSGGASWWRF